MAARHWSARAGGLFEGGDGAALDWRPPRGLPHFGKQEELEPLRAGRALREISCQVLAASPSGASQTETQPQTLAGRVGKRGAGCMRVGRDSCLLVWHL